MWIARNKDGKLQLFEGHPTKEVEKGEWNYYTIFSDFRPEREHWFSSKILDRGLFPNLTWEDEPVEVDIMPSDFHTEFIFTIMNNIRSGKYDGDLWNLFDDLLKYVDSKRLNYERT